MGAMPNEPSMEEILSSIKRIIAEEDRAGPRPPRRGAAAANRAVPMDDTGDEAILELTEDFAARADSPEDADMADMPSAKIDAKATKPARVLRERDLTPPAPEAKAVVSDISAKAARESLAHLSKLLVTGEDGQSNTLEGLVREMLRPMLKEWLDANLPHLVETLVKREIDRITGRV